MAGKPDQIQVEARRRVFLGVSGLLIILVASVIAFLQPPHAVPFDPPAPLVREAWLEPFESNAFRRVTGRRYQDAQVYGTGNADRLWLVTPNFVLSSDDFGETWDRSAVPAELFLADADTGGTLPFELAALATAADGRLVVAVGGNGFLIQRSLDGGESWQLVAGEPNPFQAGGQNNRQYRETLRAVALSADGSRAVAVGSLGVIMTRQADSGWLYDHSGNSRWPLRDVAMSDDGLTAVAIGGPAVGSRSAGQIISTRDGGETWHHQEIGELPANLNPMSVAISGDGQRVIVAGRSNDPKNRALLVSNDGATTWRPVAVTAQRLRHVALSQDGNSALAVGSAGGADSAGVILHSTDAGATWSIVKTESDLPALTSVYLDRAGSRAVIAAEDGRVIISGNGGVTWAETSAYFRAPGPWYYAALLLAAALLVLAIRPLRIFGPGGQLADHYTNDTPITSVDADRLQFFPIVKGLSHFLRNRNTEPPLTIAITGQWGSGKTSLMRLLERDLKAHGMSTVWFNAWHHQTEDSLLASLLEAVRQRGIPPLWLPEGLVFRVRLLALRLRRDIRNSFYLFTCILLLGVASAIFTGDGSLNQLVIQQLPDSVSDFLKPLEGQLPIGPIITLAALTIALFWLIARGRALGVDPARLIVRVGQRARIRDLQQQLSVRHRFASEFADVTAAMGLMSPLVIVIDDLDRCQSERVLEILESVNFLVSAGKCFVIFGMDLGPVMAAVKTHFRDTNEKLSEESSSVSADGLRELNSEKDAAFARQYLEKLINIEVPVPALQPDSIESLLAQRAAQPAGHDEEGSSPWLRRLRMAVGVVGLWIGLLMFAVVLGIVAQTQLDRLAAAMLNQGAVQESPIGRGDQPPPTASPDPDSTDESDGLLSYEAIVAQAVDPEDSPRTIDRQEIPAPGLVDRLRAHRAWTFLLPLLLGAFGIVTLTIVGRWRSARTSDTESFTEALVRWAPVSKTLCRTPRAFKRYQNRVRFLAMRQERQHGGAGLIPEPMLVALGAIQTLDPKLTTPKHFFSIFDKTGNLKTEGELPAGLSSPGFQRVLAATIANQSKATSEEQAWPPSREQLSNFNDLSSGFFVVQDADAAD